MNIRSKSVSGSSLSNGSFPSIHTQSVDIRTNLLTEQQSLYTPSTETVFSSIVNATAQPTMAVKSFFTPSMSSVKEDTPSSVPFTDLAEKDKIKKIKEIEEENATSKSSLDGAPSDIPLAEEDAEAEAQAEAQAEAEAQEEEEEEEEEQSPTEVSPSASTPFLSNHSFIYRPPTDYQTRLQRYVAAHPSNRYNYLTNTPVLLDNLLRRRNSSLFFRQNGTLASVLSQFGASLYHRCAKHAVEYSFCQYHWLVAWDSDSRQFYPFREQKRPDFWTPQIQRFPIRRSRTSRT